jgi:hypothetical protein
MTFVRSFTARLALASALVFASGAAGCGSQSTDSESTAGSLTSDREIEAATHALGLFNAAAARLDDTDVPLQATHPVWRALADAIEGATPVEKAANVAGVVALAADLVERVERLRAGDLNDAAFNAYVADVVARGTRIVPVDAILRGLPPGTDFAAWLRTGAVGGDRVSAGKILALLHFFVRNVEGSTLERRVKVLTTLLELQADAKRRFAGDDAWSPSPQQTKTLLEAAELLAGADGYVNHGDAPRILPAVPKIVAEIADQLIAEGLDRGLDELRSTRPFVYRRWTRRPNGLIGRRVNAVIAKELSQARARKVQAMQQAAAASQEAWDEAMHALGVHRHSLASDAPEAAWDTGRPITTDDVDRVVRALTGASLASQVSIANASTLRQGAVQARLGKLEDVKALMTRVELPDGIPVRDALVLVRARLAGEPVPLPWNLAFRMTRAGGADKLVIRAYRAPCVCRGDAATRRCVLDYANPQTGAAESASRPATSASGACDVERDCQALFVDPYEARGTLRATYLPYACGYRFVHAETRATVFYQHPAAPAVVDDDPDDKLDGE